MTDPSSSPRGQAAEPPVVPAYAITGGRTRSVGPELAIEALVQASPEALKHRSTLKHEMRAIVDLSERPISVAEVSAHLRVPIGVARVLVSDLAASGHLVVHRSDDQVEAPSTATLKRLLVGLRAC